MPSEVPSPPEEAPPPTSAGDEGSSPAASDCSNTTIGFFFFCILLGCLWWLYPRLKAMLGMLLEPPDFGQIDSMTGDQFEKWIVTRLLADGYRCRQTPASGDYGIDVIASKRGVRFGIQAKRYSSKKVSNGAVRDSIGGTQHHKCHVAVVATNSYFTAAARNQAKSARDKVVLVDRDELLNIGYRLDRHL